MFNNEKGYYEKCHLINGDWFTCKNTGMLYIVPQKNIIAEIEGPDGEKMDKMNKACREHGEITDQDCQEIGLNRIPDILKRFDPIHGYFLKIVKK